ncbi:alpha/beta fold hydrolase [Nocardioides daphniae]|nr:alpha/beta fold hydrolase [Nocardioides daphniae]
MHMTPATMRLHGQDLSYVDSGDGPVVLFIHGILGSQHHWSHLVEQLDDTFRVVVPDLFGHGASAKPMGDYSLSAHAATLRDLLDRLEIDTVTLVGHSLGGGIAMQFFYLFPERVERLVLVASGGLGREVSPWLRSATLPGAEQVLGVVASDWLTSRLQGLAVKASDWGWRPGADVRAMWRGFRSLGDRESRRAFLATTRAVVDVGGQTVSAHGHLEEVEAPPTLLVWGSKDRVIPAWHALKARESVPGIQVELFEGAGHFPHLDDPERFTELLRSFVASTPE